MGMFYGEAKAGPEIDEHARLTGTGGSNCRCPNGEMAACIRQEMTNGFAGTKPEEIGGGDPRQAFVPLGC